MLYVLYVLYVCTVTLFTGNLCFIIWTIRAHYVFYYMEQLHNYTTLVIHYSNDTINPSLPYSFLSLMNSPPLSLSPDTRHPNSSRPSHSPRSISNTNCTATSREPRAVVVFLTARVKLSSLLHCLAMTVELWHDSMSASPHVHAKADHPERSRRFAANRKSNRSNKYKRFSPTSLVHIRPAQTHQ